MIGYLNIFKWTPDERRKWDRRREAMGKMLTRNSERESAEYLWTDREMIEAGSRKAPCKVDM